GIHIGLLDTMRLLRCDSTDLGEFLDMAVKMALANQESNDKSRYNGTAWKIKREKAATSKAVMTYCRPAWLDIEGREKVGKHIVGGTYRKIPERVAVIKRIFQLAAAGCGRKMIAAQLIKDGATPFGRLLTEAEVDDWPRRCEQQKESKKRPPPTEEEMD